MSARLTRPAFYSKVSLSQQTVTYCKPIQTGCIPDLNGRLRAPDFEHMLAGGLVPKAPYEMHVPYRFTDACSPHLAARRAGTVISLAHCLECATAVYKDNTLILVEGAGGVAVPLDKSNSMADLMRLLGLPIILVTTPGSGHSPHVPVACTACSKGACSGGIVFNNCMNIKEDYIYHDNLATIREYVHPCPMLEVGFDSENETTIEFFCNELSKKYL